MFNSIFCIHFGDKLCHLFAADINIHTAIILVTYILLLVRALTTALAEL